MRPLFTRSIALALILGMGAAHADSQKLRILTWADYVPADLIDVYKRQQVG